MVKEMNEMNLMFIILFNKKIRRNINEIQT